MLGGPYGTGSAGYLSAVLQVKFLIRACERMAAYTMVKVYTIMLWVILPCGLVGEDQHVRRAHIATSTLL